MTRPLSDEAMAHALEQGWTPEQITIAQQLEAELRTKLDDMAEDFLRYSVKIVRDIQLMNDPTQAIGRLVEIIALWKNVDQVMAPPPLPKTGRRGGVT